METRKEGMEKTRKRVHRPLFLKLICLCDGCVIKVLKCIREVQGVETVTTESSTNKVTVTGAVDPTSIKEKLVKKTKKKVDLISPQPKKDDNKEEKKAEKEKNQDSGNDNGKNPEKKPKEAPITMADLKVQPYCQCWGCTVKIRKIVADTKGVHELKVDKVKEMVTVKGTMDVNALAEALKEKLKKNVEIVPLKKEKDGKNEGGEDGGGGGGDGGKGKKKNNKGGNGGSGDGGNQAAATTGDGNGKMEGARMEFIVQPQFGYMPSYPGCGHPAYGYGYGHQQGHGYSGYVPGYPVSVHPPHHLFNDENPNACSIT